MKYTHMFKNSKLMATFFLVGLVFLMAFTVSNTDGGFAEIMKKMKSEKGGIMKKQQNVLKQTWKAEILCFQSSLILIGMLIHI